MAVDAQGYGRGDDQRQATFQRTLVSVLDRAADGAGLRRGDWQIQQGGDGQFAVLPADEPEPRVIDEFVRRLDVELAAHNRDLLPEARLRLRIAVHYGVVIADRNGFSGQGPVLVSRLLDAEPVRAALAASPEANLVLVLSDQVFQDAVAQGHTTVRPSAFSRAEISKKEFSGIGWVHVPGGHRAEPPAADPVPRRPETPERRGVPAVHNEFLERVDARGAVFGPSYR